jgi:hypothetical protein
MKFIPKTRRPYWIRYLRFITGWVSLLVDYFKQHYIAGSAKCSTKPLSKLVTCIQSYCDTSYSWGGVNQMWFWWTLKICYSTYNLGPFPPAVALKHLTILPSTQLFLTLSWRTDLESWSNWVSKKGIANVDTNTLPRMGQILFYQRKLRFYQKVLWNWYHQHARLFDWEHVCFDRWTCFQQTGGIPIGTNFAPLLSDLFLYSYEADII